MIVDNGTIGPDAFTSTTRGRLRLKVEDGSGAFDEVHVKALGETKKRETIQAGQFSTRGFSAGVFYVKIDEVPGGRGKPIEGVLNYEWTVSQ